MKRLVSLVLLLALATGANANLLINGSFEDNLIGWETFLPLGATITTVNSHSDPGGTGTTYWEPTNGIWFALMKTNGASQEATLSQTFDAEEGGTLSFDYFWDSRDNKPFNDTAKGRLLVGGVPVATLFTKSVGTDPSDFWGTPWKHVSYTFTNAGAYTLRFSICNDQDSVVDSYLGIDNVNLEGCKLPPEPDNPDPCDGAIDVAVDTNLTWGAPCSASCDLPNGGFENGAFTPWTTVTGQGEELTPWSVTNGGMGWFGNGFPYEGVFFAQNGFDGDAGLFYDIYQEIAIPACATSAILNWSERIQWDMYNYGPATQPREYVVSLQPAGGGAPLAVLHTMSLNPGTMGDTGYVSHSVDLLSVAPGIAGQTVRINFHEYIPEFFTGPAQFDLDGISLVCNDVTSSTGIQVVEGTLDSEALRAEYDRFRTDILAQSSDDAYPPPYWNRSSGGSLLAGTTGPESVAMSSATTIFQDDMESGPNGWIHYLISSGGFVSDNWQLSGARSASATTSWYSGPTAPAEGDTALESPDIDLTGVSTATLTFNHWYHFDDCDDPDFDPDGGIVEVRVLPGLTWTQIFPMGGYPGVLDVVCENPLQGLGAYTQDSGGVFLPAVFDLTPFVGKVIHIRFHVGWDCGNCIFEEGWYIDDVVVTGTSDLTIYDVYFGTDPNALELICDDICEQYCDPGVLDGGTTYYWQVVAENSCGQTEGPVWSFTTEITNQDPDCSDAVPSIAELWAPEHKWVDIEILDVNDPDGDPVSITITGITQDEPVAGRGSGKTCPDGDGVGTSVARVRAERSGLGNGRIYEISFEADDGRGGVCSGTVRVCVPHDNGLEHQCIDDGQLYDSTAPELLRADLNDDGVINQLDFAILADYWLISYELDD